MSENDKPKTRPQTDEPSDPAPPDLKSPESQQGNPLDKPVEKMPEMPKPVPHENFSKAGESAIILHDLWKTFDGKEYIVKGMSMEIPKGALTAVIGFSGTGKSVMLKHMLGLFRPTKGSVEVLSQNLNDMTDEQLIVFRRKFGVLFQSAALFDDMTVLENVCFPLLEHRAEMSEDELVKAAGQKLEQVGLEKKHYEKLPSQISGGMQKRVGLARALALDPEILFYDEPTTGLDPILTEMVDTLILETHRNQKGKTTSVMVSHDLQAAFRIADYVAMLDAGKVILFGPPKVFFETDIELVRRFVDKGMKH